MAQVAKCSIQDKASSLLATPYARGIYALFLSPDVVLDLSEYLTAARFALLGFSNNVFAARPDGCEAALY